MKKKGVLVCYELRYIYMYIKTSTLAVWTLGLSVSKAKLGGGKG